MANDLIIDVSSSQISIALLENGKLIELAKEKNNIQFSVGDIYLGKVKKIMPGLNAAFIDVGYEKDAFLHYLDLGPQYTSLNNYVQLASHSNKSIPSLSTFSLSPDINKSGKIGDILKSGQQILVQIAKEPISTKGPRLSSEISIAGRNIVLLPFSNKVSVSLRLTSKEERDRLKNLLQSIKPENYGVIIRTVAESKKVMDLDTELRELVQKWENSIKSLLNATAPKLVMGELDRTSAFLRDLLSSSFNNIHINNQAVFKDIKSYIRDIAPEKEKIVKFYNGSQPIFDEFGVEKQIKSLFGRTCSMKNGAYLVIESTEALHSIDVNSGNRSKNSDNQETNALDVNISAAEEIARQLKLRDMGGIIVVDFIDLHNFQNKKLLFQKMKDFMSSDRAKHSILPLSKFGLMQITRQRVRPETQVQTIETCPTCHGSGEISSSIVFIDEIENHLQYIMGKTKHNKLVLNVHPYVSAFLIQGFKSVRKKWQKKYKVKLSVVPKMSNSFLEYSFLDEKMVEIDI